ncbi:metal-dependent hydrolase [Desulfogranum mediterraneum]|uniref:metal-dependent hydrolase n=1 Tax=Desulfogranum mediterraneum TaxID=160661 RepID=UPI00041C0A8E|nr:metal-dependent hydrolase [Desulfogranum mediterraneum]
MTLHLTWLSHSAFLLESAGTKILIDPFISGNPLSPVEADEVEADYILVSHGHGDHIGDTLAIAQRTGATVVANFEICNWLGAQGLERVHPQHIGGGYDYPWGRVKLTIAHHGSQLPDGSYGGAPCGFLLTIGEKKIYHACDTGLFYDMVLIGEEGLDLAILPIGDNFTMGPDDALRAVSLLRPKQVVPIHYNTFDLIRQDPQAWAQRVREQTEAEPCVLEVGGSVEI